MYIQRSFLRFTTAPTQSVICDQKKCRISVVGKFRDVTKPFIKKKGQNTTKKSQSCVKIVKLPIKKLLVYICIAAVGDPVIKMRVWDPIHIFVPVSSPIKGILEI
jgi:hypothetical protein